jgi:type VI secretion system protein VasD
MSFRPKGEIFKLIKEIWKKMKKDNIILACCLLLLFCSCFKKEAAPPPPPEPTRVVLDFEAAGDINPNIARRASPLVVRIYRLKSYSVFEDSDFISLYENDAQVLGEELVQKQEIFLKPNEKRTVFFEPSDEVETIGVLAAFRYYEQGRWKVVTRIQTNKTNVINIFISNTNMQIK